MTKRPPIIMEELGCPLGGCGATLHLTATFGWPIAPDVVENLPTITVEDIASWAYVNNWEINCEEGHTIAVAENDGGDYAHDCDIHEIIQRLDIPVKRTEI